MSTAFRSRSHPVAIVHAGRPPARTGPTIRRKPPQRHRLARSDGHAERAGQVIAGLAPIASRARPEQASVATAAELAA